MHVSRAGQHKYASTAHQASSSLILVILVVCFAEETAESANDGAVLARPESVERREVAAGKILHFKSTQGCCCCFLEGGAKPNMNFELFITTWWKVYSVDI